jgi:8-oxo-dGTP diphosphatase
MTVLLVRHAVAMRRGDWSKPDHLRPLTPKGYEQADGLVALLEGRGIARILSSPFLRCVETVTPLAARLGLPVEEVRELAEGGGASAARLVRDLDGAVAVLCSHGDVIPELLETIAKRSALPRGGELPCAKGSTWAVSADGTEATYLPPPPADGQGS